MATLKIADFLKEQQKRLDQARDQMMAARKASETGKPVPPELVREGREQEIAELKARLARAKTAREQVVARYDAEIKRLADTIARLEQDGGTIGGGGVVRPPRAKRTPAKPAKKPSKKPSAKKSRTAS